MDVIRNDEISLNQADTYSHIIISPGPGLPENAGISMSLIERYFLHKPMLGVCLGCQALAEYSGAKLFNQDMVAHGIQRTVKRTEESSWLLNGVQDTFMVGLYHSWAVDMKSLSSDWKITSISDENILMSIEHIKLPLAGVQFHPESVMSEHGLQIIENWLVRSDEQ